MDNESIHTMMVRVTVTKQNFLLRNLFKIVLDNKIFNYTKNNYSNKNIAIDSSPMIIHPFDTSPDDEQTSKVDSKNHLKTLIKIFAYSLLFASLLTIGLTIGVCVLTLNNKELNQKLNVMNMLVKYLKGNG